MEKIELGWPDEASNSVKISGYFVVVGLAIAMLYSLLRIFLGIFSDIFRILNPRFVPKQVTESWLPIFCVGFQAVTIGLFYYFGNDSMNIKSIELAYFLAIAAIGRFL